MLFNSNEFIFAFLPIALTGYFLAGLLSPVVARLWVIGASLFFYSWWAKFYVLFLLGSIVVNHAVGRYLQARVTGSRSRALRPWALRAAIASNLMLLGYYKYTNFFLDSLGSVVGRHFAVAEIILPLAISFITFQQIAYLVNSFNQAMPEHGFIDYMFCIVFFPHLISGPIVNPKELLPQITHSRLARFDWSHLVLGLTLFSAGLFKKTVIADHIAQFADPVFSSSDPSRFSVFEAWVGAFSYTFQLYFDFSGYCDMAIGLAILFGIRLPINFYSPLKSDNISDFWKHWHMTLTRFLTDFVYSPLAMRIMRHRIERGYSVAARGYSGLIPVFWITVVPTMITMFLSGLWHGAGWNFVVFGLLHGFYLSVFHLWKTLVDSRKELKLPSLAGRAVTFLSVVVSLVLFRAKTLRDGLVLVRGLFRVRQFPVHHWITEKVPLLGRWVTPTPMFPNLHFGSEALAWLLVVGMIVFFMPNLTQLTRRYEPSLVLGVKAEQGKGLLQMIRWSPTPSWAVVVGVAFLGGVLFISKGNAFLYFKF